MKVVSNVATADKLEDLCKHKSTPELQSQTVGLESKTFYLELILYCLVSTTCSSHIEHLPSLNAQPGFPKTSQVSRRSYRNVAKSCLERQNRLLTMAHLCTFFGYCDFAYLAFAKRLLFACTRPSSHSAYPSAATFLKTAASCWYGSRVTLPGF
jgi:hypothetical protein